MLILVHASLHFLELNSIQTEQRNLDDVNVEAEHQILAGV